MDTREFDLVLVGATGFVGRLITDHLARSTPPGTKIALAGRSSERLESLREGLSGEAATWPLLVIDTLDEAAVGELAARTRVVATTVGPYQRYGVPLVMACANAGTHYCDLTGEVLFVRRVIDSCHDVAERTGALIVTACGFDSIPSDLSVWATAAAAKAAGDGELTETTLFVRRLRGGLSGGTIDSARQQAIDMGTDGEAKRIVTDPYALSPDRQAEPRRRPAAGESSAPAGIPGRLAAVSRRLPVTRGSDGHWTGPFVMAAFNTRIVRRSNALLGWAYGRHFHYREVQDFGTSRSAPAKALGTSAALAGVLGGLSFAPTRRLLDDRLPKPGQGPSAEERRRGRFTMEVLAETTSGATHRTTFGARLDPGYEGTAVMFGEAALCLALDRDRLTDRGGVLTPATAMAAPLADRLRAQGFTLESTRD
ncbi:saccharopine dehydrogenase family protein [Janibacter sp. G56]|uniref:saccharopine dehydrogenase family protein n=1 Tax=Janibacter sp. G56 TaxID=3418717 RepID=UPI003CFD7DB3